jgi:hypothetical protein
MTANNLNPYAEFNRAHCDWCDVLTDCRSLFSADIWVMSICPECDQIPQPMLVPAQEECPCFMGGSCPTNYIHAENVKGENK